VLLELVPFGVAGFAVFLGGADGSAPGQECLVGADEVVLEDSEICLGGLWS